ncbi:hypothetical protein GF336_06995 [Candidatus Woesearchaeota archaeon]|nr:hypothetical protein [Candidatus Woesearchaeota archaeon]
MKDKEVRETLEKLFLGQEFQVEVDEYILGNGLRGSYDKKYSSDDLVIHIIAEDARKKARESREDNMLVTPQSRRDYEIANKKYLEEREKSAVEVDDPHPIEPGDKMIEYPDEYKQPGIWYDVGPLVRYKDDTKLETITVKEILVQSNGFDFGPYLEDQIWSKVFSKVKEHYSVNIESFDDGLRTKPGSGGFGITERGNEYFPDRIPGDKRQVFRKHINPDKDNLEQAIRSVYDAGHYMKKAIEKELEKEAQRTRKEKQRIEKEAQKRFEEVIDF